MSFISEKVAYLDGLSDGLEIDKDPNGKLIKGIIETLSAIAEQLEEQDETLDDLSDCVDDLYDFLEEDDDEDDDDDEFDEDDFVEVVCPHCGETVYFDEDMIDSEDGLICPNCNEAIELEVPGCDCGCKDKDED